jgi:hypothetical protein
MRHGCRRENPKIGARFLFRPGAGIVKRHFDACAGLGSPQTAVAVHQGGGRLTGTGHGDLDASERLLRRAGSGMRTAAGRHDEQKEKAHEPADAVQDARRSMHPQPDGCLPGKKIGASRSFRLHRSLPHGTIRPYSGSFGAGFFLAADYHSGAPAIGAGGEKRAPDRKV